MWADNEADDDLLSLDYLVDEIIIAATEPALLPLTIGVLGDWGSGKSSLLRIVEAQLRDLPDANFVCVAFSPWQYEDYEDVKIALMTAVLDACETKAGTSAETTRLRGFLERLSRVRRATVQWGLAATPAISAGASAAAAAAGMDPIAAATAAELLNTSARMAATSIAEPADDGEQDSITSLAEFRSAFSDHISSMDSVDAVVVLIDDLDRCLPSTVVDTFEVIRLFLNAPSSAFVVALNRRIVEAAIDSQYREFKQESGDGIGHDYLEKMLQIQVSVPQLSPQDTTAYVNLLLAQLHLDDGDFASLLQAVKERRAANPFLLAFDLQFAVTHLGTKMPTVLHQDLEWAEQVIPAIASSLRGNPRQTKRFLNDMRLRLRAAARRKITLDCAVLAKLMALEELDFQAFQQLFDWQLQSAGVIGELKSVEDARTTVDPKVVEDSAEVDVAKSSVPASRSVSKRSTPKAAAAQEAVETAAESIVATWAARPAVRRWLAIDPPLAGIDLGVYFTYFRSRLVVGSLVAQLSPELQALVARLTSDSPAVRRAAAEAVAQLGGDSQAELLDALLSDLRQHPDSAVWEATGEVASRAPNLAPSICVALASIPHGVLPHARAGTMLSRLPSCEERTTLIAGWQASSNQLLSRMASLAARAPSQTSSS